MFILFVFLSFCVSLGISGEIQISDCPPGTKGAPEHGNNIIVNYLKIEGCNGQPCAVEKFKSYLIEVKGTFNYTAKHINYTAFAQLPDLPAVPLYVGRDMCEFVTVGSCNDIAPGVTLAGQKQFPVEEFVPIYDGKLRIIIKDDEGKAHYCGELSMVVKEGSSGADGKGN